MAQLSKCGDSKFELPNKSIASDPNQAHVRLALSIQCNIYRTSMCATTIW